MKKIGLFLLAACITGISSCGPDAEVDLETEVIKGRPTVVYIDNDKKELLHYTSENQLSKIVCDYTGVYEKTLNIHYSGNDITGCTYTRNPEGGGISKIDFNKIGNERIHVSIIFGENGAEWNQIIDLNNEGLPVRYSYLVDGNESLESEISYMPNSSRIHQIKRYVWTQNSYTVRTHTLEYDDNPGITGNINCPVWFRLFLYNIIVVQSADTGESYEELINYVNNVVKEKIHVTYINPLLPPYDMEDVENQYAYDEEGYPVSATKGSSETITIINEEGKPVSVPKEPSTITIKY